MENKTVKKEGTYKFEPSMHPNLKGSDYVIVRVTFQDYTTATMFRERLLDLADRKISALRDIASPNPDNPFFVRFKLKTPRDRLFCVSDIFALMDAVHLSNALLTNISWSTMYSEGENS